jgi:menaquinone-dependent protoporphyrinogen oxidase
MPRDRPRANLGVMVLVAYATKHGSTREVAEAIADALAGDGMAATVRPAVEVLDLTSYDAVILGSAIYTGRLHRDALRFLERHRRTLAAMPFAMFAAGPRTLEPDDVLHSRIQVMKTLQEFPELDPAAVTIFGGVVDPTVLRWPFNRMPASDARDWDAIATWARGLAGCREFRSPPVHV